MPEGTLTEVDDRGFARSGPLRDPGRVKKKAAPVNFVPGVGPLDARIALVGEGPGDKENERCIPFVGPSGKIANSYFLNGRIARSDILATNLVHWRVPQNGDPTPDMIEANEPILWEELNARPLRYIIAAGAFAVRYFCGQDIDMDVVHGIPQPIRKGLLKEWGWKGKSPVLIPVYHPASGMHNLDFSPIVKRDFQWATEIINGARPSRHIRDQHPNPEYEDITKYTPGVYESLCGKHPKFIALDTEGLQLQPDPSKLWGYSFSSIAGTGYVVRTKSDCFEDMLRGLIDYVIKNKILLVIHNTMYDFEMFRYMGFDIPGLRLPFYDTMIAAYNLRTEPQGLKAQAYRLCGMKMGSYEDQVRPYQDDKALDYLNQILLRKWDKPDPVIEIKGDEHHLKQPQAIGTRAAKILIDYEDKGPLLVDPFKRWHKVDDAIKATVAKEIGPLDEGNLEDAPLELAVRYSACDADAPVRIQPLLHRMVLDSNLEAVLKLDHSAVPMVERMQYNGIQSDRAYFESLAEEMQDKMDTIAYGLRRFNDGKYVNPNSPPQVRKLLYNTLRVKPSGIMTKKKENSTNKKAIESLRGKDLTGTGAKEGAGTAVEEVITWREHAKVKDSFALPLARIDTGRIRCTIRITRVHTGRLSAANPPLLAMPIRTALGRRIREGFVAAPGMRMGTWDLNQVEMRYMAHISGDEVLCDLFNSNADIHSRTAATMFHLDEADVDKLKHRYPAKRVGFGVITGISGKGLLNQMQLAGIEGWSQKDCEVMIESWFNMYPGVRAFLKRCRSDAERTGEVRDWVGRVRHLPAAQIKTGWKNGIPELRYLKEEAKRQSHSHIISAGAQSMLKNSMAWIDNQLHEWREADPSIRIEPLLQVHDELMFEFTDGLEDELGRLVVEGMTQHHGLPNPKVPILASGGTGYRWDLLEK